MVIIIVWKVNLILLNKHISLWKNCIFIFSIAKHVLMKIYNFLVNRPAFFQNLLSIFIAKINLCDYFWFLFIIAFTYYCLYFMDSECFMPTPNVPINQWYQFPTRSIKMTNILANVHFSVKEKKRTLRYQLKCGCPFVHKSLFLYSYYETFWDCLQR